MTRRQLQLVGQVATLLAVAAILYLTLTPAPPATGPLPPRLGHVLMFAGLGVALALWYATADAPRRSPRRMLLVVLLLIWLFAAATELGQELIDERSPDINDWFANMVGGIAGLLGGSFVARALLERDRR